MLEGASPTCWRSHAWSPIRCFWVGTWWLPSMESFTWTTWKEQGTHPWLFIITGWRNHKHSMKSRGFRHWQTSLLSGKWGEEFLFPLNFILTSVQQNKLRLPLNAFYILAPSKPHLEKCLRQLLLSQGWHIPIPQTVTAQEATTTSSAIFGRWRRNIFPEKTSPRKGLYLVQKGWWVFIPAGNAQWRGDAPGGSQGQCFRPQLVISKISKF